MSRLNQLSNVIYISSGYLSSVEKFNKGDNEWTQVAPMKIRRSGLGVAVHNGMWRLCLNVV